MLPWPKIATESPMPMPAVSTAATLSLSDCRQAASLSEIRSSTCTRAISGSRARSAKQPGSWKPMIGPLRQRWSLPVQAERAGRRTAASPAPPRGRRPDPGHARADLDDAGAEFVAEELHRGLGLEPALDAIVGERRDAEGELGLGDARLDAERLDQHVPRPADRLGHVVEPHVAEAVESPGFHDRLLTQADELLERVAVGGTTPRLPPADQVTSPT